MLTLNELKKTLLSYNINSQKYGPTIYQNNQELGICLEIKDSTFGFLTRVFSFNNQKELEEFLNKYFWYKKNVNKYNIILSLNKYDIPNPKIIYTYNKKELTLNDMLNIKEKKKERTLTEKDYYLKNIEEITNYIIGLSRLKEENKKEKNKLKEEENNLKYELLEVLKEYYGKAKGILKKPISKEIIKEQTNNLLQEYENVKNKELDEITNYLNNLIVISKNTELDEKNLINIYSCNVYKYNIRILKKQINFVKRKINSEKNFNLKGSKLQNIDAELKSFLKTENAPIKYEEFQKEEKERIELKYNNITDLKNAYSIISGNKLELPKSIIQKKQYNEIDELKNKFDSLDEKTKSELTLYNSIYKNICNFIITKKYPNIEEIKKEFDWNYYYKELQDIVLNEENNYYYNHYFKYLDFKDLDHYINSIVNICKTFEKTKFKIRNNLKVFCIEDNNSYKSFTVNPIMKSKNRLFIINLLNNTNLLYIPDKIEIDKEELSIITTKNIYIKADIIEGIDSITLNEYKKIQEVNKKSNITITKDLELKKSINFNMGELDYE